MNASKTKFVIGIVMALGLVMSSCQPQVIEVEKEVPVDRIVEVEKEVIVEKIVEKVTVRNPRTLIIAVADDTGSEFDPDFGGGSEAENEFGKNIHAQWFQYDRIDTGEGYLMADAVNFTGDLIESWEIEDDGVTINLKVRKGMTFRDTGDEVTADDLLAWIERSFRSHAAGEWILNTGQVHSTDQVTINGPHDMTIKLSAATPLFFPLLRDQSSVAINGKAVYAAEDAGDELAKNYFIENDGLPGEYKMISRTPGVETVLEWDETYWAEPPYFHRIILKVIPSSTDRALLLRNGNVDIAKSLSMDELSGLSGDPGVKVWSVPSRSQIQLGLLNDHPPFDDVRVRQAVAYAVPYADILNGVYQGKAAISVGGPVPVASAYQVGLEWPYTHDLDKAKALVAEAGAEGATFTAGIKAGDPSAEAAAILIQAELAKVGLNMEISKDPDAVYGEKRFGSEYDAFIGGMNAFVDSPYYYLFIFYRSGIYCCNFFNYANPRVDEINDILATEVDPAKITPLWTEAVEHMINDVPAVFMVDENFQVATRDDIGGLVVEPDSLLSYRELYRNE